jgi:hypothetical protein
VGLFIGRTLSARRASLSKSRSPLFALQATTTTTKQPSEISAIHRPTLQHSRCIICRRSALEHRTLEELRTPTPSATMRSAYDDNAQTSSVASMFLRSCACLIDRAEASFLSYALALAIRASLQAPPEHHHHHIVGFGLVVLSRIGSKGRLPIPHVPPCLVVGFINPSITKTRCMCMLYSASYDGHH